MGDTTSCPAGGAGACQFEWHEPAQVRHSDTLFVSAASPRRETHPGNSLDASISRRRHNRSIFADLLSDARVSIAQLANSTQATISVTVESQVCEFSMDDLRNTMGPHGELPWRHLYRQATMCMMSHCANDGPSRLPILTKLSLLVQFVFFVPTLC